jgi:hypothetical protein
VDEVFLVHYERMGIELLHYFTGASGHYVCPGLEKEVWEVDLKVYLAGHIQMAIFRGLVLEVSSTKKGRNEEGWCAVTPFTMKNVLLDGSHRSGMGAFFGDLTPKIEGHFWSFFSVIWREHFPFKCLKGVSQSVNFFVLLLIIHALSHLSAEWKL